MSNMPSAIFLDRDGVINKEVNYLSDPNEFKLLDGTIEALRIFQKKGYLLIVITNQSGLARGYFSVETLNKIHDKMRRLLKEKGIRLDDIIYCPHHPDFTGECECRKPKPGMILEAQESFNINIGSSYMVGDKLSDIEAGQLAGCKTVLLLTGHGLRERKKINQIKPDFIFNSLLDFAKSLRI
ncbi:MAG: D-glycero-beta-D-manno-heptose-1,7-bisphosphate 7-phosphatase [Promethearchaeota archaeon]|nr:MAG: D-glycero-beta-D-manno-heptose-1,7-bisphosphate 7-phosphatase [Candidatus Lokiarchaeota archaeon]